MQGIGPKLEQSAEATRRGGRPERELLHERSLLALDQALELAVKVAEFGVLRDIVQRGVVALVALVFPNVN